MEFFLKKTGTIMMPVDEDGLEQIQKLKNDTVYKCKVTLYRSIRLHKLYFALLRFVFNNQDKYSTLEGMRRELMILTERFDVHVRSNGETAVLVPHSISFPRMSEDEFKKLIGDTIDAVMRHLVGHIKDDDILWQIAGFDL